MQYLTQPITPFNRIIYHIIVARLQRLQPQTKMRRVGMVNPQMMMRRIPNPIAKQILPLIQRRFVYPAVKHPPTRVIQ